MFRCHRTRQNEKYIYFFGTFRPEKSLSPSFFTDRALHSNVSRKDSKSNTAERDVTLKNVEVLRARQNSNKGHCPNLRNTIYWTSKGKKNVKSIDFQMK